MENFQLTRIHRLICHSVQRILQPGAACELVIYVKVIGSLKKFAIRGTQNNVSIQISPYVPSVSFCKLIADLLVTQRRSIKTLLKRSKFGGPIFHLR